MFSGFKSLCVLRQHHPDSEASRLPIHNIEPVQVLERTQQFGRIEPTPPLIELALALQMVEQLSAVHYKDKAVSEAPVTRSPASTWCTYRRTSPDIAYPAFGRRT